MTRITESSSPVHLNGSDAVNDVIKEADVPLKNGKYIFMRIHYQ